MRIYIAGPMSGCPFANKPMFDAAAKAIRDGGDTPISPVEVDLAYGFVEHFDDPKPLDSPNNIPGRVQMFARMNLQALEVSEGICLLPGWENSKGAVWEAETANRFGLEFFYFEKSDYVRCVYSSKPLLFRVPGVLCP